VERSGFSIQTQDVYIYQDQTTVDLLSTVEPYIMVL